MLFFPDSLAMPSDRERAILWRYALRMTRSQAYNARSGGLLNVTHQIGKDVLFNRGFVHGVHVFVKRLHFSQNVKVAKFIWVELLRHPQLP